MTFTSQELKHIASTVSAIAIEVGERALKGFYTSVSSLEKTSPHDVVTKFDKEGEEYIYQKLSALYPDYGFLGEEGGYRNYSKANPFWIVDPIDGTLNFSRGIPAFSVSIALVHHGEAVVGVCFVPMTKELFCAKAGEGATLNGAELTPPKKMDFAHSILSLSPSHLKRTPLAAIRRSGSSVIDICYVAKGAIDGFYDSLLNPWDFAASSLIAKEAGAEVFSLKESSLDMNKKSDILVTNKHITDSFTKWILEEA
ncbi:inositol monophosphatase [bacterium]|nr:inositol monophosphatase [bacterium]